MKQKIKQRPNKRKLKTIRNHEISAVVCIALSQFSARCENVGLPIFHLIILLFRIVRFTEHNHTFALNIPFECELSAPNNRNSHKTQRRCLITTDGINIHLYFVEVSLACEAAETSCIR